MICTIDIGNTRAKVGFFEQSKLIRFDVFNDEKDLLNFLKKYTISKMIISCVGVFDLSIFNYYNPILFNHKTKIPIVNKYKTPTTLGIDRLAAIIGANSLFPEKDILVVDAGTCITYDFINSKAEYLGGGISPGIKLKYKALHNFTSKLPLVDTISETPLIGDSTESSIMTGVINGTISEISEIIERYKNISDNFAFVFCGGDSVFLSSAIDKQMIVEKNLVLIGLNKVLEFNE